MLYSMRLKETTAAAPRVVDAHGLLHLRASKAVKACDAADAVDGLAILGAPTLRLAATAYGVSIGSVARALRLTPEQRQAVRQGKRPLILPRAPAAPPAPPVPAIPPPAPPVITPVIMGVHERLKEIVSEIGLYATLDLLAASEKVAA
jgi:hypothetical protein